MAARWRVVIDLDPAPPAWFESAERCNRDLARELRDRTGVVVVGVPSTGLYQLGAWLLGSKSTTSSEWPVTAFAGDRATAEAAARVAQEVASRYRLTSRISVECWRPVFTERADTVGTPDVAAPGFPDPPNIL